MSPAKIRAALVGISGRRTQTLPVDFSAPPSVPVDATIFETFAKKKRLDLPALTRAFYRTHPDRFDTICAFTDFGFDNGQGVAHSFNVRNDVDGIGLPIFDSSSFYGSRQLATILMMGDIAHAWPADPQVNASGIFSAHAMASLRSLTSMT